MLSNHSPRRKDDGTGSSHDRSLKRQTGRQASETKKSKEREKCPENTHHVHRIPLLIIIRFCHFTSLPLLPSSTSNNKEKFPESTESSSPSSSSSSSTHPISPQQLNITKSRNAQPLNTPLLIDRLSINSIGSSPAQFHRIALAGLDALHADRLRDAVLLHGGEAAT